MYVRHIASRGKYPKTEMIKAPVADWVALDFVFVSLVLFSNCRDGKMGRFGGEGVGRGVGR